MVGLTACQDSDEAVYGDEKVNVDLAFSLSSRAQQPTRMTDAAVQTQASQYRGMDALSVLPFNIAGERVTVSDHPKAFMVGTLGTPYEKTNAWFYHYADCHFVAGTNAVLFYGHATLPDGGSKSSYGSLQAIMPALMQPADIQFRPDPIMASSTPTAQATALAAYLTDIAHAEVTTLDGTVAWKNVANLGLKACYLNFINQQNVGTGLMAGSSVNVRVYVNALYESVQSMPFTEGSTEAKLQTEILRRIKEGTGVVFDTTTEQVTSLGTNDNYPASIGLPDGAAVLRWEGNAFVPQTVTTTLAAVNTLIRYAYPADLYYFANSRICTSNQDDREQFYESLNQWTDVLDKYERDNGTVNPDTKAVAIKNPIQYAVACLQVKLNRVATTQLADADGTMVTVGTKAFPMTAVIVGGQRPVGFDFKPIEPVSDADVCFVYDGEVKTNGGDYYYLSTTVSESSPTNTLVLQNADGEEVKVVLEFVNNSDTDFKGVDGMIYKGTKFYLVGSVKPQPVEANADDYKKRVFTQDYTTTLSMTVQSLAKAYRVLPNLLQPRLEIGVQLTTQWVQAEPQNVILE